MEESIFSQNLEYWRKIFPEQREIKWRNDWLENAYCKGCRLCCGPQGNDKPYPMGLLDSQITPSVARDFYMLNAHTAYLGAEGCKSLSPNGCRLPKYRRPIACGLFPFALVKGKLYLYKACPGAALASMDKIKELTKKIGAYLRSLPDQDARRISIDLSDQEIADKYLDLDCVIFESA